MDKFVIKLIPVSLPKITQGGSNWEVRQRFHRLGYKMELFGWGVTRRDALHRLASEIYDIEHYDYSDPWQGVIDALWSFAGWVDKWLSKQLAGT